MTNSIPAVQNAETFAQRVRAELNTTDVAQQLIISVAGAVAAALVIGWVTR